MLVERREGPSTAEFGEARSRGQNGFHSSSFASTKRIVDQINTNNNSNSHLETLIVKAGLNSPDRWHPQI
jgi:hypothetical protein